MLARTLCQFNRNYAQADSKEAYKQEADIDTFQIDTVSGSFNGGNADGSVFTMATRFVPFAWLFTDSHPSYANGQSGI